jgi:hypothetical protein
MSTNEYYYIEPVYSEKFHGDDNSQARNEDIPCPITNKHLDGSRKVGQLHLDLHHNERKEWIIWWLMGNVVHQKIVEEFEKEKFTGFRTEPATVRFRDGEISQEYREFIVTGWAGMAKPESGVKVRKDCSACHWKNYTAIRDPERLVDWSQWTGADFFMVWPLPLSLMVTGELQTGSKQRSRGGTWSVGQQIVEPSRPQPVLRLADFRPICHLILQSNTVGRWALSSSDFALHAYPHISNAGHGTPASRTVRRDIHRR